MHLITPTCTPYLTVLPDATLTRYDHAQAYSGTSGVYASSLLKPKFAATWSENVLRWETDLLDTSDKPAKTTEDSANTASSTQIEGMTAAAAIMLHLWYFTFHNIRGGSDGFEAVRSFS